MELRMTSFFIWALQGSITSQVRSTPGPSLWRLTWVISLGKGSKCNSSTESNQLSSRWTTHITWASMVGFSQIEASILNLIYVNITYYLHKTLQWQASGYYNLSLCCLTSAITLEKLILIQYKMNSLVLPPSHVRALDILVTNKHRFFQYKKNTSAIIKQQAAATDTFI